MYIMAGQGAAERGAAWLGKYETGGKMSTQIYGASDDLIEIQGDLSEEFYGGDKPTLLIFSDGTALTIKYGKEHLAVWAITLITQGKLFMRIAHCTDEDAERYSDTAHFNDGLKWAYVAKEWSHVKAAVQE